jgi:hypothetical protein
MEYKWVTEYMIMLTNEEQEALRKKYFPRVNWTEEGPVRRVYRVQPVQADTTVLEALTTLARREWFIEPEQQAVVGDADQTLEAFRRRKTDKAVGMIFGTTTKAVWCDLAVDDPDEDDWQRLIVRSEEAENLTALAHGENVLRFRRA